MITKEQALTLRVGDIIHGGVCTESIGCRGAHYRHITRFCVNGEIKTWKRSPERFALPIKHGINFYAKLQHINSHHFHLEKDCPVLFPVPSPSLEKEKTPEVQDAH